MAVIEHDSIDELDDGTSELVKQGIQVLSPDLAEDDKFLEEDGAPVKKEVHPLDLEEPELSVEDRARQQGWRPKNEYRGEKDLWVDAKEFLFRGSYIKRIKQLEEMVTTTTKLATKAREDERRRVLLEIENEKKAARSLGEFERYDKALKREQEVNADFQQFNPAAPSANITPAEVDEFVKTDFFKKFATVNPYVEGKGPRSRAMLEAAIEIGNEFRSANPHASKEDECRRVHTQMRKEFPTYQWPDIENKSAINQAPRVAGVSLSRNTASSEERKTRDYKDIAAKLQFKGYAAEAQLINHIGKDPDLLKETLKELRAQGISI